MRAWLVLAVLVGAGVFLFTRSDATFFSDLSTGELISIGIGVVLVTFYLFSLLGDGTRPLQALRYLVVWIAVGFALIAGYSYREDLMTIVDRVGGELVPTSQVVTADGGEGETAVQVRRRLDGHFAVRASVNGQSMTLMVDTGASSVVLRPVDAERAGVDLDTLSYTVPVDTANGMTYAAAVRLRSLAVGPLMVRNVEALVARPGSVKENLLGMSFLKRLRSYEFAKDTLTLRG